MAPPSGRLYAKGVFTGFKRGLRNQHENTALVRVEGCEGKGDASWYIGKRVAYVYRVRMTCLMLLLKRNFEKWICWIFQAKNKTPVPGKSEKSNLRVIWGKVTRTHGNAGSIRAKFAKNLPPTAMGRRVRIMMYPSRI